MVDLGSNEDDFDSGALRLGNGRGQFTAELGNTTDNRMALTIKNRSAGLVAAIGESRDSEMGGAVKLWNASAKQSVSLLAKGSSTALSLFDSKGTPVANVLADPEGRGLVSVGSAANPKAGELKLSERTGNGVLAVMSREGIFAQVGVNQTTTTYGDLCVNSSKQKGTCFSALAAKNFFFYW